MWFGFMRELDVEVRVARRRVDAQVARAAQTVAAEEVRALRVEH